MAKELIDARKIRTGKDGELYDGDGNFLAQINTWQAQINVSNSDYTPAGTSHQVAVFTGTSATLTFTETVVKDAYLLKKVIDELKAGKQASLNFQGKLNGSDGTATRVVMRSCVPDGTIDLLNVQPGDVISRAWSWRVNELPDIPEFIGE